MDAPHGGGLGGHPVVGQQFGRQRVGQLVGEGQRRVGAAGVAGGGQTVGARVDSHERTGRDLGHGTHQRVGNLAPGQCAADAPLKVVGLPHHQIVGGVGRIEPSHGQNPGIVCGQHPVHDPPAGDAPGRLLLQDGGPDAAVHIVGGRHDGVGLGVVDIFARVAQKQVTDGDDAEFFKFFGESRANALEVLDGVVDGGQGWRPPFVEFLQGD